MSGNWQAAEEGDLQDELDLDLDQFVILINFLLIFFTLLLYSV